MKMRIFLLVALILVAALILSFFIKKNPPEGHSIKPSPENPLPNTTVNVVVTHTDSFSFIDSIPTENYANPILRCYYYVPASVAKIDGGFFPLLLLIPYLSGRGEEFVTAEFKNFAEEERFIIISPSFVYDEQNWESKTSYQFPAVWSGNALLVLIDKLPAKTGISLSSYYLFGFSAGAQFSLRFCLWKPELCRACAAHGSGSKIIPDQRINVQFLITVGTQDTERIGHARDFYNKAQELGIDATYREYNTGHVLIPDMIRESLEFFKKNK
jgi:hypothetical protein